MKAWQGRVALVLDALAAHPEARLAVAGRLAELGEKGRDHDAGPGD